MLNRYRVGEEVKVYRDVFPHAMDEDNVGVVKSFYFDKHGNTDYIVSWRDHEIVCKEKELEPPKGKKYKYHKHYINQYRKAVLF